VKKDGIGKTDQTRQPNGKKVTNFREF